MDNNTQTKNLIIASVVVLILIVGGVWYSKKYKNLTPDEAQEPVVNVEDASNNTVDNPVVSESVVKTPETKKEQDSSDTQLLKAEEALKKAKWNKAMENARTAVGRGQYDSALTFYNEALSYYQTDTGYSGLFVVYSAQNNIEKARIAIESAISLDPKFTEYRISKLVLLDEKTDVSFTDLKKIYVESLSKVNSLSKINLVTAFARIAENNKDYKEAIEAWESAKQLYPSNAAIYQAEIDRLQKM